jgi:polar amino acid transport system ATP-binding protein
MLSINALSKTIRTKPILKDFSLKVEAGSIALLMGRSGVGKSTLLRILAGLDSADIGTATLDGIALSLDGKKRSQSVGMVFQHFNLFDVMTVAENITFPLIKGSGYTHTAAEKRAQELLTQFELQDFASRYPGQLSGGQKQRLAIARALAQKPQIICLDEPTSALDPLLAHSVASQIQNLATEGYHIIVASHDTKLIEALRCTLYLMENGTIIESCPSDEFNTNRSSFPRISDFLRKDPQIAA